MLELNLARSLSQREQGQLFLRRLVVQAKAALSFPLSWGNFLIKQREQCGGKAAKMMLELLTIKLLLSTLQHFRRIHLYIKNEYANCKPFLCIL